MDSKDVIRDQDNCYWRVWIAILFVVLSLDRVCADETGEARRLFAQAQQQFKSKRYDDAYRLFRRVEVLGYDAPILQFNIGSAALKSGRLLEARAAFVKASVATRFETLSYFNLGLVAVKREKRAEALGWFTRAYGTTTNENLRRLCIEMSARLIDEAERLAVAAQDWLYLVGAGAGYEDAVIDPVDNTVGKANFFAESSAFAQNRLVERDRWGMVGRGESFVTINSAVSDLNLIQIGMAIEPYLDRDPWRTTAELGLRRLYLGGQTYETIVSTGARIAKTSGAVMGGFRYVIEQHLPTADFSYLEGVQHGVRADIARHWTTWVVRSHVAYEYHDRSDFRDGNEYTSYSPDRRQVGMELQWSGIERHVFATSFDWRGTDYHDPDVDVFGVEQYRREVRSRVRAQWRYQSTRRLAFVAQWEYLDNDVSIEGYSYSRHQIRIGGDFGNF